MRIEHSITIAAPLQRVWALTMDVENWPRYTPTMTSVECLDEGPLAVGSEVRIKQPGQGAKVWAVTVLEPESRFAWSSRFMGSTMTATHQLAADGDATTNTLIVDIEGRLAPVVGLLLRAPIRKSLRKENEGFKAAAEKSTAST